MSFPQHLRFDKQVNSQNNQFIIIISKQSSCSGWSNNLFNQSSFYDTLKRHLPAWCNPSSLFLFTTFSTNQHKNIKNKPNKLKKTVTLKKNNRYPMVGLVFDGDPNNVQRKK